MFRSYVSTIFDQLLFLFEIPKIATYGSLLGLGGDSRGSNQQWGFELSLVQVFV